MVPPPEACSFLGGITGSGMTRWGGVGPFMAPPQGSAGPHIKGGTMRIDYQKMLPTGMRTMAELERAARSATLEPELMELVRTAPGSA